MSSGPEQTNRMGRPNQPPQPECCRMEGQVKVPETAAEQPSGGVHRDKRGPQAGVAPCLSNTASKGIAAGGDRIICLEPNMKETAKGEVSGGLPGSESVARAEDGTRNLGDPTDSRRSNCGNQAGRQTQRQEEDADGRSGVRSTHSSSETGEGVDVASAR